MTPERWRHIGELFDAAVGIDSTGREAWLRAACGEDEDLRVQVHRLLAEDERADQQGLLRPPESAGSSPGSTTSWPQRVPGRHPQERSPTTPGEDAAADGAGGFTPRQAIARRSGREQVSEPPSIVRARLRELPVIYILILVMVSFWRRDVLGNNDLTLYYVDAGVIATLGGIIALLWSQCPISLPWLRALELGMVAMLACRVTIVQYRLILEFSLLDDRMMAQLTMKNVVLLTSILILTSGLHVPKSWRRAALMAGPLAVLPFATLLVLYLRYPHAMSWLKQGWIKNQTTSRVALLGFDALILLILAVGATFGTRTISRLRRQVAEARQLGQYRLLRRIGAGGMGEVYLAEHQLLKRPCAVKLIRQGETAEARTLQRFECEVRLTATLSHPNTVEIYDYGRAEDGTYYYVMEYLRGQSLAELVERRGPLPPARVVYLLRQVCGALREAHAEGLIHRDIKPSNIFAARCGGVDDVAKLLDFGLVRTTAPGRDVHVSAEGEILGTPLFMSPEQATGGRELDERSDIYSLGGVAYYLLTGRPPFEREGGIALLIAHARDPVVPPSRVRPGIPQDLERVVERCLAKGPAERFPDVESLERALGACSCAGDWNQDRATQWWRDGDTAHTTLAKVK
jgi:serine/threonine-protein kinase